MMIPCSGLCSGAPILSSFRFVKLKLPLSTKHINFIVKKTYIFHMFEGTCLLLFCLKVQTNPYSLIAFVWRCFCWETKGKNPTSHISFVWRWFSWETIEKNPTSHISFVYRWFSWETIKKTLLHILLLF